MQGTPLLLGPDECAALQELRELAAATPVDMPPLLQRLKTGEGKAAHMRQMNAQSIEIPVGYLVTFSIETGHPAGVCRHMSMSSPVEGRVPIPEAVWMVAEELGFSGSLEACAVWLEDLQGHGKAVNVVQPLTAAATAGRA